MNKILLAPHPKLRQKSESIDRVTEKEINNILIVNPQRILTFK